MAIFSRLLASSAFAAVALLSTAPHSVEALVAGSDLGHIGARHASSHQGITPNHVGRGFNSRKRNEHRHRKRCVERSHSSSSSSSTSAAATVDSAPTTTADPTTTAAPAPAPAPETTTAAPAPNNGGYSGGGKVVLAWPNGDDSHFSQFVTSKVGYYYTWSPHKVNVDTRGVKFAPMLWGSKQIGDFTSLVKAGYADVVLGMNEPDLGEQSALDPAAAADLWNTYIGPLRYQGYRLGSPATTSGSYGLTWMQDFLGRIGEKPDFLALHWYGTKPSEFISYVENYHNKAGGYNVWVTEFACMDFTYQTSCSADDAWAFMNTVSNWMDGTSWVEAYAPYGVQYDLGNVSEANRLMKSDGSPTDLAYGYIN